MCHKCTALYNQTKRKKKRTGGNAKYRSEAGAEYCRALARSYGSLGAASPFKKIDPATGAVIAIIPAKRSDSTSR